MPRKAKTSKPRRRVYRKKAYKKRMTNVPDYAGRSEVLSLTNPAPIPGVPPTLFAPNAMYQIRNFTLDQFPACVNVARSYQFYKIKRVSFKFIPLADTFTAGGGQSVPNMYYMIDRSGSIPANVTLDGLKAMGAKPLRFDDKTIVRGFAPSVLTVDTAAPGVFQSSQYKISPWLSTNSNALNAGPWNPSTIDHMGIFWYVQQEIGNNAGYRVEITIEFQFKKPLWTAIAGEEPALAVKLPTYTVSEPVQVSA